MGNQKKPVIAKDAEGNLICRYESVSNAAKQLKVTHGTVLYWIREYKPNGGLYYEYENQVDAVEYKPYHAYKKVEITEDKPLDRDLHTIIKYDTRYKRISVTPCPFKKAPKPMVGSGLCQSCGSFRGRNRQMHEVACSFNYKKL